MIPKTLKDLKKVKTVSKQVADLHKQTIQSRIRHIDNTAKRPKYGDQRLPAPRRKAIHKYEDVLSKIDKIPKRAPKLNKANRIHKLETKIKYNHKQPSGVAQGHRSPVVSKPYEKAIRKLKSNTVAKQASVTSPKLPGRGTKERRLKARSLRNELRHKRLINERRKSLRWRVDDHKLTKKVNAQRKEDTRAADKPDSLANAMHKKNLKDITKGRYGKRAEIATVLKKDRTRNRGLYKGLEGL